VDAPESAQRCLDKKGKEWDCGKAAKAFLEGLVAGRQITCKTETLDRYKRSIAICHADKVEINKEIVRAGYGVAYVKYNDVYLKDEQYAQLNKHGIWQGTFIEPEKYRRSKKKKASLKKNY
jgi:endonuclease YncB( thermonuclease family)